MNYATTVSLIKGVEHYPKVKAYNYNEISIDLIETNDLK